MNGNKKKENEANSGRGGGKRLAKKQPGSAVKGAGSAAKGGKRLQTRAKAKRRLTWKELLIVLIPAVAAVIAVVAIYLASRDIMSVTLEGEPVQYYGIGGFPIRAGTTLRRTSEDNTVMDTDGAAVELSSLPVYFEDRGAILLTQDMAYYAPRSGKYGRVPYFTELRVASNGTITALRNGKEQTLESGFLYDGKDFYVFLEPMIVSFNGYRLAVPALSYVEAVYTGDVMVFNYGSKTFFLEPPKGNATADIETGDYSVSLLGDSMTRYDGERTLLFTRPELLDPVE